MIFFKSKYGWSRIYARWLAERTGQPLTDLSSLSQEIKAVHNPIFITGAYAGGLNGAAEIRQIVQSCTGEPTFIICGLADPLDEQTLPAAFQMLARARLDACCGQVFFVRGGMDYRKLSPVHRVMMWGLYQKVKKDPDFHDNGFLETYGKAVDFTNPKWLDPVLQHLKTMESGN